MMKKIISVSAAAAALITIFAGNTLHSKADMKIETASFSVTADRTQMPSAFCLNADGSPIGEDFSNCGKFCIDCCWHGNATIMSIDGDYAYCIGKHWQKAPTSLTQADKCIDIPTDEPEYAAIFSIAAAGASSRTTENGLCDTDLYYVTQCAIRSMMYGIEPEELAFFDENGNFNEPMTNEFLRLREAAHTLLPPQQRTLFIDGFSCEEKFVYIDDDCYFRYGPYYPYISDSAEQPECYTVDFEEHDDDIFVCNTPEPDNDENMTVFPTNSPLYIFINAPYQEETSFYINADLETTSYDPVVYLSYDSSYQNIAQLKITDALINTSAELCLKNTDTTGEILITKKFIADGTDIADTSLISEPRFAIKNSIGKYVNGINVNGKIIFDSFNDTPVEYALNADSTLCISDLPVGEYYICEIKGAKGFVAENQELLIENTPNTDECDFINYIVTTTAVTTATEVTTTTYEETTTPTETTTPEETTAAETTTETTTAETIITTSSETTDQTTTTEMTSITVTITDSTYMTNLTTDYETLTETTSETTEETTISSDETTSPTKSTTRKTTTYRRTSSSPKTGSSSLYLIILAVSMTTAAIAAFLSRK